MELDSGVFIGQHYPCIAGEFPKSVGGKDRRPCSSSDALCVYEHETKEGSAYYDATCFSCKQAFTTEEVHASSIAHELGVEGAAPFVGERKTFPNKASKKEPLTVEERKTLWYKTGWEAKGYRGLTDEVLQFYGHRTELNEKGEVQAQYYPETRNNVLVGYKSRHHPKVWGRGNVGCTGVANDLSGQHKFPTGGRDVLIVGGESDKVAAQVMLRKYQVDRGQEEYNHYAVVSPTTGEPSAAKQCRAQYDWFNKFDNIIIGMDSDEAGEAAAEEIAQVLPKEKIKIANWSGKDPNKMLQDGRSKQFLSDFFNADPLVYSGVFGSGGLMPYIQEALRLPRINLPPYMAKLESMTKGEGLIGGRIYNVIGMTSVGKSTFANSMVYHFAFNPNEVTAVVSLEATKGEYGVDVLSLHLETNLYWREADEVQEYLNTEVVRDLANKLFLNEYGGNRFYVVDDREGTVESLQKLCEKLKCQYGVTIIVIDVLTDLLRVTTNEEQAKHLNWQSNFVKGGVTIFNVLHTRKPQQSKDGLPKKCTEYDALGSGIFVQKSAGNIVINRNKESPEDDYIERNSTYVDLPKMRQGETGEAGVWYYDPDTRKVYDRDQFFKDNPDKLPPGYDLTVSSFDKQYWEEGGRGYKGGESSGGGYKKPIPHGAPINVERKDNGEFF